MPNHRAPTNGSRALSGLALTTAAVGASLLSSVGSAAAAPTGDVAAGGPDRLTGADHGGRAADGCDIHTSPAGLDSALEDAGIGEIVCVPARVGGGRHRAPEHAAHDSDGDHDSASDAGDDDEDQPRHQRRPRHARHERGDAPAPHLRPMTSGERQYRNGCTQGYIVDDCGRFSLPSLLHSGIDPNL